MDTKGYELPSLDGIDTPEKAGQVLNKIYAEMSNPEHPYMCQHPQHADFVRTIGRLHEIAGQNDSSLTQLDQAMQRALDHIDEQQGGRVEEAEGIMAQLNKFGYRDDEIPGDICRYELDLLRLQLQAAKGEWETVLPRLRDDLQKFQAPRSMMETLVAVQNLPGHLTDFKLQMTEQLLFWLRDAKRAKYGRVDIY